MAETTLFNIRTSLIYEDGVSIVQIAPNRVIRGTSIFCSVLDLVLFSSSSMGWPALYDKEGKILKGNLFGLFAITRSLVYEPFEFEIKAAKGEHTLIETVYYTMW